MVADPVGDNKASGGTATPAGISRRVRAVVVGIVVACLVGAGVGVALATRSSSPSSGETPQSFLARLFTAIQTGNSTFLYDRLNPIAIAASGAAACHSFVTTVHAPTATFHIVSVGTAVPFPYVANGRTVATIRDVVPVAVTVTNGSSKENQTIHIAARQDGTYTWFGTCGTAPTSNVAAFAGSYLGMWHNTTFSTSGGITLRVHVAGKGAVGSPVRVTLTLSGAVFGATAPAPETFVGSVTAAGMTFSGTSAVFGQLTWHVAPSGALIANGAQVPGGRVSSFKAAGLFTSAGVTMQYKVTLVGGTTASGTMSAEKVS